MIDTIQHNGPIFIMLMGLPGSGKSTLRKSIPSDFLQLSTDDLIEDAACWKGLTYSEAFADEIKPATVTVNSAFRQAIKDGTSIVWDQTNLTRKKRRGVLTQLPSTYYTVLIQVQCDEDVRQQRLAQRPGKVIPAHIDASMRESMVEPIMGEGWNEIWVRRT